MLRVGSEIPVLWFTMRLDTFPLANILYLTHELQNLRRWLPIHMTPLCSVNENSIVFGVGMFEIIDIHTPKYEFIAAKGRTYFIHLKKAQLLLVALCNPIIWRNTHGYERVVTLCPRDVLISLIESVNIKCLNMITVLEYYVEMKH